MRIRYNAPTTLSFTIVSALVLFLSATVLPGLTQGWFSTPAPFRTNAAQDYVKLFTHVLGHGSLEHFLSNFSFILLLGPILEVSYGSLGMLVMMAATSLVTGLLNVLLFPNTVLLGASGIVFMMILLSSFTNFEKGEVPLTFILVMVLFLGKEIWNAAANRDNISQFAHILGGLVGSFFGFLRPHKS
ncbi:MAG: rhomboid family intramembrane serine protease [Spirochaetaceae bacterium]|nr:rhomboid family intramembrane serine protease [Spirochaetaceae bacterium]